MAACLEFTDFSRNGWSLKTLDWVRLFTLLGQPLTYKSRRNNCDLSFLFVYLVTVHMQDMDIEICVNHS
jgi:hypothetical protein